MKGRRWLSGALRFSLGLALLYLALRGLSFQAIVYAFGQIQLSWFLLTLVAVVGTQVLKAARWYLLLRPVVETATLWRTLGVLLVGQAGNILIPLRGGDIVRGWLGSGQDKASVPAVATGMLLEKGLDGLMLAAGIALAVPNLPAGASLSVDSARALAIALAALAVVLLLLVAQPSIWPGLRPRLGWVPWSDWLLNLGDRFADGLLALRRSGVLGRVLILTLASWGGMYAINQLLLNAMGIRGPWSVGLVVMVLVLVGIIPGLMPGQVGPFYFFAQLALRQYAVPAEVSAAYAVVLHALYLGPPLIGAALYLMYRRGGRTAPTSDVN